MNYNIIATHTFKRQTKRLVKKYHSLTNELIEFEKNLSNNPFSADEIIENIYKLRLKIKSKGKGKSGGARVIYYAVTEEKDIYLLSIYDKSDKENISNKEIAELLKEIQE